MIKGAVRINRKSLVTEDIYFPSESYGECRVYTTCKYIGVLGDGWCPRHWDRIQSRYQLRNVDGKLW